MIVHTAQPNWWRASALKLLKNSRWCFVLWLPMLKLGYSSCHSASHSMERYERIATRNSRKISRVDDDGTGDGAYVMKLMEVM